MNTTITRYGIIGCGSMGREHIENIKALPGALVTAVADTHQPSIDAALALLPFSPPKAFADHRELLASGLCDAVVIATPNFTHIQMMRDALATDLHILVEKPLVTKIEDGVEMMRLAEGRKGLVWVAQEYRYMPPVAEMIRMAHQGAVGTMHQVAIREHREPFYPKVGDWNRFSANTGGTLVEKCCHYFNLMDLILQEKPKRVFASGGQRVNHLDESYGGKRPDILDSAFVIVEYPSGARASLDLCMFAENSVDNEQIVIVGDEGKLESLLPSLTLRYGRREDWGRREVWGQPSGSGKGVSVRRVWDTNIKYAGQHFGASYIEHQHFLDAVRNGKPAQITLEEGLRSVATGLAAHRSIELGRAVELSEVLPSGW
ncbi:Gfo/Idh/MocA family oxidoreductase [Paucibacter sp. R3-3]|uniref:Gfo/Idh/MocA family oxidoreductase n=1 Tax=Roseateles agri TaxID=3098619 RepID=A0ABU5DHT9_9BURK|nr:Gfo/Idh/MocA family oxidoreductase [Paucibacter sp. R3-3]MDY0745719.1 Gfo/Idh/MocA family oxidoreductase [Paucibacter sp. R3-3]